MTAIFLFAIIVVFVFIAFRSYRLNRSKGGEYIFGKTESGTTIIPSIGQIEYQSCVDNFNRFMKAKELSITTSSIIKYMIERAFQKHLEIARYEWGKDRQEIAISALESARYMSDAHIDMLTLGTIYNIKEGYAANEFIGDECRCERNEYMSYMFNGNCEVKNSATMPISTDTGTFFSFTPKNKREIEKNGFYRLHEIADAKLKAIENIKTITEAKELIQSFKTERESHLVTKRLREIWCRFDNIFPSRINTVDDPLPNYLESIEEALTSYSLISEESLDQTKPRVNIYIEFSYDKDRMFSEFYRAVHLITIDVLRYIINSHRFLTWNSNGKEFTNIYNYLYRFDMRKKIYPYPGWKMAKDKNKYFRSYSFIGEEPIVLRFYIYDECINYKDVCVPKTTGRFSYDEGMLIQIMDTKNGEETFNIQVEHSENSGKHKSNFVEFIARNTIPYLDGKDNYIDILESLFRNTNYLKEDKNKFSVVLLDGTDVPLAERRLFKEFGPYADELF